MFECLVWVDLYFVFCGIELWLKLQKAVAVSGEAKGNAEAARLYIFFLRIELIEE
jgi:hypothetical protein